MNNKTFIINTYSEDKYRELSSSASAEQLHIVDNDNLHRTVVPSYDLLVDKVRLSLGYDSERTDILLNDVDGNVISRLPAKRFISDNYLMSAAYVDGKLILSVMLSNDEVNAISVDFPVDQSLDPLSDYVGSTYPIASKAVAVALSGLSACIGTELETLKTDMAAADKILSDAIHAEAKRAATEENAISEHLEETKAELTDKIDKDVEEAKSFFDDKLATEAHDRFDADQSLGAQITAEAERAKDVESTLDEKINKTSSDLIEKIEDPLIARYIENDTRRHLILRNHDNILGELSSGIPINLAMVSKWNIADFGSIAARMNLNTLSTDGIVTINDKLSIATTDDVQSALADANSYADEKVDSSLEALSGIWKADNKHIVDQVTQIDGQVSVTYKALAIAEVSGLQDQLDSKTTKEEVEDVSSALSTDYVEKISDAIADEHVVKYADGDNGRKHIKLKNYDSITGYLSGENASDVNLAMVSKWNVADFGSKTIPLNLNAAAAVVTINDSLTVATTDDVNDVSNAKLDSETFKQISTDIGLSAATTANKVVTQNDIKGLSGAMILVGKVDKDSAPTLSTGSDAQLSDLFDAIPLGRTTADPVAGDVVIQTQQTEKESETVDKEFVWTAQNSGQWNELGSEGVYATKFELGNETQARETADESTLSSAKKYADDISAALSDDYDAKIAEKLDSETFRQISTDIGLSAASKENRVATSNDLTAAVKDYALSADVSVIHTELTHVDDFLSTAIEQKVWIEDAASEEYESGKYGNLSVVKIAEDEYMAKVADDTLMADGVLYVISSDHINAYGQKIVNVASSDVSSDVANVQYVNSKIDNISVTVSSQYLTNDAFKQISNDIGLSAANADNQIVTNKEISGFADTYVALSDLSAALSALSSAEIDNIEIGEIADALFSIKRLVDAKLNKS